MNIHIYIYICTYVGVYVHRLNHSNLMDAWSQHFGCHFASDAGRHGAACECRPPASKWLLIVLNTQIVIKIICCFYYSALLFLVVCSMRRARTLWANKQWKKGVGDSPIARVAPFLYNDQDDLRASLGFWVGPSRLKLGAGGLMIFFSIAHTCIHTNIPISGLIIAKRATITTERIIQFIAL